MASKVELELSLVDRTSGRLRDFARDVEALAKASQQVKGPGDQETVKLQRMSEQLRGIKTNFGSSASEAQRLTSQVKDLGSQFQGLAATVARTSGLGGSLGSLIGITSVGAAVTAVGVIVGQSLRMAYEFEKASVKAAAALSVGMGAGFAGNIGRLQSAAYQGEKYGYNVQTMVDAMAIYGRTSGAAMPAQAGAQVQFFAQVARSYGLEPGQVAGLIGGATRLNGQDALSAGNSLFGAAERGGNFGRRTEEFIGAATSALATLQYANPDMNQSVAGPAAFMSRMGQLGGYFGTGEGATATYGAIVGASQGGPNNVMRAALMSRAGLSPLDMLYGRSGANNKNSYAILNELTREYGSPESIGGASAMVNYFGQDQARTLDALYKANGNSWKIGNTTAGANLARAEQAMQTPSGQIIEKLTQIENTMTADGVKLLDALVKAQNDPVVQAIEKWGAATVAAILIGKGMGPAVKLLGGMAARALGGVALEGGALAVGVPAAAAVAGLMGIDYAAQYANAKMGDPYGQNAYFNLRGHGVDDAMAVQLSAAARFKGMTAKDVMLGAIAAQESSGDPGAMNAASGAMGLYQFEPDTADRFVGSAFLKKYGSTKTARGRAAFLGSVSIQHATAQAYLADIIGYAHAHGMDVTPEHIAQAWVGGEGAMGHPEIGHQYGDDPGRNVGLYGAQVSGRFKKMSSVLTPDGVLTIESKVNFTPHPKRAHTGSRISNRPLHHPVM